jgi:hypothetical protein
MRNVLCALALVFALAGVGFAQEGPDAGSIGIKFANLSLPGVFEGENLQGVNVDADVKLFRAGILKLLAAGDYTVFFPVEDIQLHTFQAGPKVSVDLTPNRKVSLYGQSLFGTFTTFNDDAVYSYKIGGGLNVNVTKRLAITGGYDRQFVRYADDSFNILTIGGRLRF